MYIICFKTILFGIFLNIFSIQLAESILEYRTSRKSRNEAEIDCESRNLQLLSLTTYQQYIEVMNYFDTTSASDSWLGLHHNDTTESYYWLNGQVLTELKWKTGEPVKRSGQECVVMDVTSGNWYTQLCTVTKRYICVGTDGDYSVGGDGVDFYIAVLICQSEGRRLPVAITKVDSEQLNTIITTKALADDIWLGLIEYGDYYRWVTGEDLTPPYSWASSTRYDTVHYHHTGLHEGFHCSTTSTRVYLCQTVLPDEDVPRNPNNYRLLANLAIVLDTMRSQFNTNPPSKFECSLACLKDSDCVMFSLIDSICRTFGNSLYVNTQQGIGGSVWMRQNV